MKGFCFPQAKPHVQELKENKNNITCIRALFSPQDPNEDTEWNDILRKKGILPPKEEPKDNEEEELALQQQSVGKINPCAQISLSLCFCHF